MIRRKGLLPFSLTNVSREQQAEVATLRVQAAAFATYMVYMQAARSYAMSTKVGDDSTVNLVLAVFSPTDDPWCREMAATVRVVHREYDEIDPDFIEIGRRRWEAFTLQLKALGLSLEPKVRVYQREMHQLVLYPTPLEPELVHGQTIGLRRPNEVKSVETTHAYAIHRIGEVPEIPEWKDFLRDEAEQVHRDSLMRKAHRA